MSHDKTSGTATRKERRKAKKGEHQATARAGFRPANYVRNDWTTDDVAEFLEFRARGYNGRLREILCTAAAQLRAGGARPVLDDQEQIDAFMMEGGGEGS